MPRTIHVFTGPTLSAGDVHAVIPGATVHPPVAAGDLLGLGVVRGDVVVIIDGYFQQAQAVRHKEILLLIERGVEVWGAGSMGALRAAELHRLGMHGTGAVFRLYTRGVIEGDDEVGVTHGPAERGYPVVADALVNIRCTVRQAVRAGLLSPDQATRFIAVVSATPFQRRTVNEMVAAAVDAGIDAGTAAHIATLLTQLRVDVKRRDALRALHRVQAGAARWARPRPAVVVSDNAHLRLWNERTRASAPDATAEECTPVVTDRLVLAAAQLYAVDYPEFAAPITLRTLATLASPLPAQALSDDELYRHHLGAAEDVDALCAAHHLDRDELLRHLRREERLAAALGGRPDIDTTLARIVLDAADQNGVLAESDAARWEPQWLRSGERSAPSRRLRAALRALAVAPGLVLNEPFLVALKLSGRFTAMRDTARAALAFNEEVRAAHPEFAVHLIDANRVVAWFAERWDVAPEDLDLELADRGFASRDEFIGVAKSLYMADKFRRVNDVLRLGAAVAA